MNTLDLEQPAKAIEAAISDFQNRHDVNHLLSHVRTVLIRFAEELIVSVVQKVLSDQNVLTTLKALAAKSALRFNGFKPTSIRLLSGRSFSINSPYFAKSTSKMRRGRKKSERRKVAIILDCHTWVLSTVAAAF